MKKLLILIFIANTLNAQSIDIDNVKKTVEKLRITLLDPNEKDMLAILHRDLTYGHSTAIIENFDQVLHLFLTGKYDFTTLKYEDIEIKVNSNVAIVRHKLFGNIIDHDKPAADVKLGVLMTFLKEKNQWKLIARQGYRLP